MCSTYIVKVHHDMTRADRRGVAVDQVLEVAILMNQDMTKGLGRIGLTAPRAHLLWELQQRGPCTQSTLAKALGVSPRNVTGLVDALVETGFVTREPHPHDRRATLVSFTRKGKRTAQGLVAGRVELADYLFAGVPDRKLAALVSGLDVVLERLRAL
jgi:DNA-binding MarR family transcriptional regulator